MIGGVGAGAGNRPGYPIVGGVGDAVVHVVGTGTIGEPLIGRLMLFDALKMNERDDLIRFCKQHGLVGEAEPNWYLSSFWGA